METIPLLVFLVGRLMFGGYFIYNGINHFKNAEYMAQYAESKGVPYPDKAVIATGVLLLAGGFSVALGIFPYVGLGLIILFLLPVSVMMHDFWSLEGETRQQEQVQFLKNMALAGAALALLSVPQPWAFTL